MHCRELLSWRHPSHCILTESRASNNIFSTVIKKGGHEVFIHSQGKPKGVRPRIFDTNTTGPVVSIVLLGLLSLLLLYQVLYLFCLLLCNKRPRPGGHESQQRSKKMGGHNITFCLLYFSEIAITHTHVHEVCIYIRTYIHPSISPLTQNDTTTNEQTERRANRNSITTNKQTERRANKNML